MEIVILKSATPHIVPPSEKMIRGYNNYLANKEREQGRAQSTSLLISIHDADKLTNKHYGADYKNMDLKFFLI